MGDHDDASLEELLGELSGALREGRRRLLVELRTRGYSIAQLRQAISEDRLAILLLDEVLADGTVLSVRDIADAYGLDPSDIERTCRLLGFRPGSADEPFFTEAQRAAFGMLRLARDLGVSDPALDALVAVIGQHLWQLASDALIILGDEFAHPGDTECELAHRYEDVARVLVPAAGPLVGGLFGGYLRTRMRENFVTPQEAQLGHLRAITHVAVAFVDVVGFTGLSERVEAGQLKSIATRLADAASSVIEPPVRLVKTIGDAIMLMSRDTHALVDALLKLFPVVRDDPELPAVHAGLACGPAHIGGADVYGSPVNLASRLTDLAPTERIWTHDAVTAACPDHDWRPRGHQRIRGLQDRVAVLELWPFADVSG
jgi:adenylate cyclase